MQLYEKYRPKTLDQIIGQGKAVKTITRLIQNGAGGRCFWISGISGSGKTTLARIIAGSIADDLYVNEYDSADQLSISALDKIEVDMQYRAFGKGGKCFIINEAHGLRKASIRRLLGLLERIPDYSVLSSLQPNRANLSCLKITLMRIHCFQDVLIFHLRIRALQNHSLNTADK